MMVARIGLLLLFVVLLGCGKQKDTSTSGGDKSSGPPPRVNDAKGKLNAPSFPKPPEAKPD